MDAKTLEHLDPPKFDIYHTNARGLICRCSKIGTLGVKIDRQTWGEVPAQLLTNPVILGKLSHIYENLFHLQNGDNHITIIIRIKGDNARKSFSTVPGTMWR